MKKIALSALLLSISAVADASVLNFDSIGVQNSVYPYYTQTGFIEQGFQFSNNSDVVDLVDSSWNYGAHSGEFAALNDYYGDMVVTLAGGGVFSFQNTYVKGWANSGGFSASITGYFGNQVVGQVDYTMGGDWQLITGNFNNIDRLVFSGGTFLVDDVTLNAVPVPAAAWLFGSGLMGLVGIARRQLA